jgi:hypothetical protein
MLHAKIREGVSPAVALIVELSIREIAAFEHKRRQIRT